MVADKGLESDDQSVKSLMKWSPCHLLCGIQQTDIGVSVMIEERTLRTSRVLPFSPKEIYGAFASADLLASWWGPEGFSNTFEIFEFTTGGRWKFVMHGPDGKSYLNESFFKELVPDSRIVIHHDCPPNFRLTIELTPEKEGTDLIWEQVFEDAETAQAVKQRAGTANEQNIDRLIAALSKAAHGA
ncbi:SRPBCC domain-containing protein [Photobacterium sp. 53610]|uniref:SRPBCC domain-containing protein n=1 Tax=Photobacterium sp. 53610 TaxID=3102789 RepID=UPI002ED9C82D